MNRIISFCKQYKHALLPILYAPVYLLIFFYLEKKPVSQIHVIEMSIDRKIPFCEYFVIPYYLWFLYVAATVVTFVFLERKDYYKLCLTLVSSYSPKPLSTASTIAAIASSSPSPSQISSISSPALTPWHAMQRSVTTKKSEPSDRSDMAPYCSLLLLYCQHSSSNSTPCLMY